jgi:amino acid transporter
MSCTVDQGAQMTDTHTEKAGQLGTFAGVFTPSILTILGIILFLRLGYVVGNAGLARAILIIGIANLISVLTSFSLAAIATNMKVKGGGDYYLISRTLGFEFGGAIGIVLFLAQSVSIGFYCIGFGEAVCAIIGTAQTVHLSQIIAGTALAFLFILAWTGADLATKFQYVVMTFLVLALLSFYIGGIRNWDTQLLIQSWSSPGPQHNFWILFALFFPAVTGFTQGVSMSGDLKDSGKSLPVGTFSAVFLSIIVYFSIAVIFAASSPLAQLASDYGIMKKTAYWGLFIDAGVIAATLSSAMASFLGAPRILQSLSADKTFPILNRFAKGVGKSNNPRRGILLSFAIALATIFLGQLDLIAGIVSMFFLISYGLLNYATFFEANAQSPSFRPRFKWYNKRISLMGFIACLGIMLAIDFKTGIAAVAVLFAIYHYLKQSPAPARWSDSQRSYSLKLIRDNLIATQKDPEHPREWRPFILALSDDNERMMELLDFSALIEGKSGMTTAVKIIQGSGLKAVKLKETAQAQLTAAIKERDTHAFPLALSTPDLHSGLSMLFQSFGIGPVKANTVLFSWNEPLAQADDAENQITYISHLRLALQNECNVILLDKKSSFSLTSETGISKTIDIWWIDDDSSRLMILLAYLITRNESWEDAQIRLLAIHLDTDNQDNIQILTKMLEEIRIDATPQIILGADAQSILSLSKKTDLVFLPFTLQDGVPALFKKIPMDRVIPHLNTVALVLAAQKVDLDTEPEEGKPGELAILTDALAHAEKQVDQAQKAADQASKAAEKVMASVHIENSLADSQVLKELKQALDIRKTAKEAEQHVLDEKTRLAEI